MKNCKICGSEFEIDVKKLNYNQIACSKECSKFLIFIIAIFTTSSYVILCMIYNKLNNLLK